MNLKYKLLSGFFILIFISNIFALSTFEATQISKDYVLDNEFVDGTSIIINCKDNDYFVTSILNSSSEIVFFVVLDSNGDLYLDNNIKPVMKTAYVLKKIKIDSKSNYLGLQLSDKINNLVTILESKRARLQGVINSDYSSIINDTSNNAKDELNSLIDLLNSLNTNIVLAYNEQQDFISIPSCSKTDNLITSLQSAFQGYDLLTSQALNYKTQSNSIIEQIVSDSEIPQNQKQVIISYVSAPTNLSQEVNTIYDSISKTNSFYTPIISDIIKTKNNVAEQYIANLESRESYVLANNLLYDYDADLDNSLENIIQYILSSENKEYWENEDSLNKLQSNYKLINDLFEDKKYNEAIPKLKLAKSQSKSIINDGFKVYEEEVDNTLYYVYIAIALVLIVLLFVLMKKQKKGKSKYKKKSVLDIDDNKSKDPFS